MNCKFLISIMAVLALIASASVFAAALDEGADGATVTGTDGQNKSLMVGDSYSCTLESFEGEGTWTVVSLPSWLSFNGNYTISGTSSAAGSYTITMHIVGPNSIDEDSSWTVTVNSAPATYTVTFDSRGGSSSPSSVTVDAGEDILLPYPGDKAGYLSTGWYTASTGGSKIGGAGARYIPTSNITLYAHWAVKYTYQLQYDANGGSGAPSTSTMSDITTSHTFNVKSTVPTRDGYIFLGWSLDESDDEAQYSYGDSITLSKNAPSKTLFAVWTVDPDAEEDLAITSITQLECIAGSTVAYTPTANVPGCVFTIAFSTEAPHDADWLTLSGGILSGVVPDVEDPQDQYREAHVIIVTATSPGGQVVSQQIVFHVFTIHQILVDSTTVQGKVGEMFELHFDVSIMNNLSMTASDLPAGIEDVGYCTYVGVPTLAGTYEVTFTSPAGDGPEQVATCKVTIIIAEADLEITSSAPDQIYPEGSVYEYTAVANQPVTWSLVDAPDWLAVFEDKVVGSVTGIDAEQVTVTYTLSAMTPGGQVATQAVTVNVEDTLGFTSVPTASCVVIPVYHYNDDGTVSATVGDETVTPVTDTFRFVFTGTNAETVTWDFGDGTTAEGFSVVHTYNQSGTYTYTCTATNDLGEDTVSGTVTANVPSIVEDLLSFLVDYWPIILIGLLVVGFVVLRRH